MNAIEAKKCSRCGVPQSIECFHRDRTHADGRSTCCKSCATAKSRVWRLSNPEAHRNHVRQSSRRNRPSRNIVGARWRAKNSNKIRLYKRRHRLKRAANPVTAMHDRIATQLRAAIAKNGRRTIDIVGYTGNDLRVHLERQFLRGMTWQNRARWHVDHIVPQAAFPQGSDPRTVWALSNLRPLWKRRNLQKHAKREFLL